MYEFLDRRYAFALYKACSEVGNTDLVLEELGEIVDELEANEGLRKIIKNPQINRYNKKRIFIEMFDGDIEDELLNFLLLLIDKGRILYLKEKYIQFKQIYLKRHNTVLAKVKSVIPLDENQKEDLKSKLEKKYKKTIIMEEEIDKALIGGVLVTVGNEVIDGTIRARLEALEEVAEGNVVNRYNYGEFDKVLEAVVSTSKHLAEEDIMKLRKWLKTFYKRNINIIIDEDKDKYRNKELVVTIGSDVLTKSYMENLSSSEGEVKELKNPDDYLA
ncbi:MAG: F0F1 ATP synthase subunit delta [Clostridium sp.]|nr:F0F1 ATP synthase subunit delta [Clostridium sp.]MDU7086023.1 F0F1 ATP synthase subunit delta [Clostridium sp.]